MGITNPLKLKKPPVLMGANGGVKASVSSNTIPSVSQSKKPVSNKKNTGSNS